MKHRLEILTLCMSASSSLLYAGDIIIADKETKLPIEYATVFVWTNSSENPVRIYSDEKGRVDFPINTTKLTIKKLGYEDKKINDCIHLSGDTILIRMGYVLREVSVSAIKNNFHIKSDRYIYDVAADSSLAGRSTFDALGRIPILKVSINGSISSMQGKNLVYKVNGLTNPLITGNLETALRSLKADDVKRIEMRDNPTGNAPNTMEINIVTKGRLEGFQSHLASNLSDNGWRTSLWGLTKINKFCISGAYYYMRLQNHDLRSYMEENREGTNRQIQVVRESTDKGYRAHLNSTEVSMSYDIDDNTIISAFGRVLAKGNPHNSSFSNTVIRSGNQDLVVLDQSCRSTFDDTEYSASVNYEKLFGANAENGKFYLGYDFYKRPNDSHTEVRYDITQCNDSSLLPSLEAYDRREYVGLTMHTAMAEYRRHFFGKHTIFANATYRYRSDKDFNSMVENKEDIKLRQNLLDGSFAYKFATNKFSFQTGVGIRMLYDKMSNSKYGPDFSYSRHHQIWQPGLQMAWIPASRSRYELSYGLSYMIPDISVMNPFVFQDEPTRRSYGNPKMSPEKTNKISVGANYNFSRLYVNATLSGAYTSDIILQYSFLDDKKVLNITFDNIANRWNWGLSSFMSWNINRNLSLRTNLAVNYIDYSSNALGSGNSGFQFNGNINLSQELPWRIYGELRGSYNTPWINFQGKGGRNYGYGFSLERSFMAKKLRVSLSADNFVPVYYTRTYNTEAAGYLKIQKDRNFHAAYFVSVSYSFGNLRARVKETESSISNNDIKNSYDE